MQTKRVAVVVGASLLALSALQSASAGPEQRGPRTATVALVTTQDFRVAVVATRLTGRAAPNAEVRVGLARRAGSGWRELGEKRLGRTYFWNTVSGPRALCRLAIATSGEHPSFQPFVVVQLLLSPSLGCGRSHRIPLAR